MATTAMETLTKRLQSNPDSLAFARLADYYREAGDIDNAVTVCIDGLERHPQNVAGHLVLGRCCLARENFSAAAGELTEVCRLDPRHLVGIKLLGDIFIRQGQADKAGDLYALVESMDPFCDEIVDLARAHQGTGKTDLFEIFAGSLPAAGAVRTPEPLTEESGGGVAETLEAVEPDATFGEGFASLDAGEDAGTEAEEAMEPEPGFDYGEMPGNRGAADGTKPETLDLSDYRDMTFDGSGAMPEEDRSHANGDVLIIPKSSTEDDDAAAVQPLSEIPNGSAISARIENLFERETIKMPALADVPRPDMKETAEMIALRLKPADAAAEPDPPESATVDAMDGIAGSTLTPAHEPAIEELITDASTAEPIGLVQDGLMGLVVSDEEEMQAQALSGEMDRPAGSAVGMMAIGGPGRGADVGTNGAEPPPTAITETIADALIADADQDSEIVVFEEFAPDVQRPEAKPPEKAPSAEELTAVKPDHDASAKEEVLPDYIITPTFAEIFFQQGQLHRALNIFQRLAERDPDNVVIRQRIDETEKAIASGSEACQIRGSERGSASKKVIDDK